MRRREMALRKVNGAGNKDLFVQLTVELLIVQFIALVAGLFFIEICMSRFLEFTRIAPQLLLWRDFSISVYCDSFVSFVGSDTTISFSSPNFARRCQRESFSKQTV